MLFSSDMSKEEFFGWLQQRFVSVYHERLSDDFVQSLTNPAFYNDHDSISWVYDRLYSIYGENVNVDFMKYLEYLVYQI